MLTIAQLAPLKDRDPYLYETLVKIVASVNATSQRAGVDPSTPAPAPAPIASVTVQAANGWFDISITDPSDAHSQYIGSLPSGPVTFGAPPIAIAGGGASGPAPLPSSGSGALPNGLLRGGNGFGLHPGARVVRQSFL